MYQGCNLTGILFINSLKHLKYYVRTNEKGEKLYILTVISTNDIKPYIRVNTWEKCKELFSKMITEQDDDRLFAQLIHKEIDEEFHKAEASMRCNRKGWVVITLSI